MLHDRITLLYLKCDLCIEVDDHRDRELFSLVSTRHQHGALVVVRDDVDGIACRDNISLT